MWDNGGMNIKRGQAEIFDTGPLNRDYIFNMEGFYGLKRLSKVSLNGWATYLSKRLHTEKELEIPNIPGLRVNKYRY